MRNNHGWPIGKIPSEMPHLLYKIGFIGAKIGRTPVNGFVAWLNLLCCLAQQPFTGEVPYISL